MASQAIGSLYVSLGLDTAAFTAGVKQAQGRIEAMAGRMAKVAAGMAAVAGPALAALAVSATSSAAEINRASQLANAGPEEFQGLAVAAKSVGIEQEKLADILKDVNDRVGDFIATGGGPMKDFFDRIAPQVGVTAEQFRNLSGPQALQLYVSSLEKANVNQQDFTFFMEAMASDSTALVPLLRNGGKAVAEYAAKAQALGVVLDSQTVASFAKAKQSFSEVQMAFAGFGNIIAAQIVPPLKALADAFVTAAQEGHWLGNLVRGLSEQIPRLTSYVVAFVGIMGARWAGAVAAAAASSISLAGALGVLRGALIRTGIGALVVGAGELVYRFSNLVQATGGFSGALSALKAVALEVWQRIGNSFDYLVQSVKAGAAMMVKHFLNAVHDMIANLGYYISQAAGMINQAFGTSLSTDNPLAGVAKGIYRTSVEFEHSAQALAASANQAWAQASAPLASVAAINEKIAQGAAAAAAGMNSLGAGIANAGAAGEGATGGGKGGLSKVKEQMTELQRATEEWRESIKASFAEFVVQGGSFKAVLSDIIAKLAEMLANSAFDAIWGAVGGDGIVSGILSGLGIDTNANGTRDFRGGLTRVNERGGEIMNLPKGTQIIPNDISKRMADSNGGKAVAINVNVSGARGNAEIEAMVASGVSQGLGQYDRQMPDRLRQITKDDRRR